MDLFTYIRISLAFLSCLPLKNGLLSGKPAISPIYGVVSERKKKKVSSLENHQILRFLDNLQKIKKGLLTSQMVGIDKRLDLKNISLSSLEKLQILCDTPEMVS